MNIDRNGRASKEKGLGATINTSLDRADELPRLPHFLNNDPSKVCQRAFHCSLVLHHHIISSSYHHHHQHHRKQPEKQSNQPTRLNEESYASVKHPTRGNGKGDGKGKFGRLHSVSATLRSTFPTNREALRYPEIVSVSFENIFLFVYCLSFNRRTKIFKQLLDHWRLKLYQKSPLMGTISEWFSVSSLSHSTSSSARILAARLSPPISQ